MRECQEIAVCHRHAHIAPSCERKPRGEWGVLYEGGDQSVWVLGEADGAAVLWQLELGVGTVLGVVGVHVAVLDVHKICSQATL